MDYATIWAAGPVDPYDDPQRKFGKPKALLDIGGETVISRLVRQLRELDIMPVIGMGQADIAGWTETFVAEFHEIYSFYVPYTENCIQTGCFLLHALQKYCNVANDGKIYLIPGDFVFSDKRIKELTEYTVPCVYSFRGGADCGFIITGEGLSEFLTIAEECTWWGEAVTRVLELGWASYITGVQEHSPDKIDSDFVEIDFIFEWEAARRMCE